MRLARSIGASKDVHDKNVRELLILSLCSVLSSSGRAAPERLDEILKLLVKSSDPRYLDRLKRGAKFANEIISARAIKHGGNELEHLGRAAQAILQGIFNDCS